MSKYNLKFNLASAEIAIISLFICSTILYWFFGSYTFSLTNYTNLQISQATIDGIDISKRVSFFYKLITGGTLLLLAIYFSLIKLKNIFNLKSNEIAPLTVISTIGFFTVISSILGIESTKSLLFISLLFIYITLPLFFRKKTGVWHLLSSNLLHIKVLTIAFILLTLLLFISNSNPLITNNAISLYFIISLGLTTGILILKKYSTFFTTRIFNLLLPLSIIPLSIFTSSELLLYFKLKSNTTIPYQLVSLAIISSSFLIFSLYRLKWGGNISSSKTFKLFYTPSALISFLILVIYQPLINQPNNLFELANPAISQMRIFAFKELPIFDFLSSHLFSEQFYGIIYNFLFGYDGSLDFLAYSFMYEVTLFIIIYFFLLKTLKNSTLSLIFILIFPFTFIFFSKHIFYSIIPFFLIRNLIANQTLKNYLLLLFSIVFLCSWRLDTGISSLFASIIFFAFSFFIENKKLKIKPFIKAISISLLTGFSFLLLVTLVRSKEYIYTNIQNALHYISANQAHGFSLIAEQFNQQFYIYHFILPLISVLIIIYAAFLLKYKSTSYSSFSILSLNSSIFLFLVFIINFQRGLVRHSFIENKDTYLVSTFYIATAMFLISFIKKDQPSWKFIQFFSLSFCLIIFIKYFPIGKEIAPLDQFLTHSTIINLDKKINEKDFSGRIIPNTNKETYSDIKNFLDQNLSPNQTFLDFSNSPMLYFFCQRKVPSYFCQSLQNTVDDYLQISHLNQLNTKIVPVVIYSNYPENWLDNTDGVSNRMRQHLIAEYIYKNYAPYRVINNHSIWVAKNIDYQSSFNEKDTLINSPKTYNYGYAAHLINKYITSQKATTLKTHNIDNTQDNYSLIPIDSNFNSSTGIFVNLSLKEINSEKEYKVELFSDNKLLGTTTFTSTPNESNYMIPLSNHYFWYSSSTKYIKVFNDNVKTISLHKSIQNI